MRLNWIVFAVAVLVLGSLACGKGEVPPPAPGTPSSAGADPHAGVEGAPPLATSRDEAGSSELPPGHPPLDTAPQQAEIVPPPEGSGTGAAALVWNVPGAWRDEPPANAMRKAQYRIPGPGGDGECVVNYFGPGQGGDPMANAERWASQFTLADGSSGVTALKTSDMKVGDVSVLIVEVAGTYSAGMSMGMAPSEPQPGYKLLGAVAEGTDANWFFKFTGPEKTVDANRAAFEGMLKSIRRGA